MSRSMVRLALTALWFSPALATTYTADVAIGSDGNPGTASQPFKTLAKCVSSLRQPGDVCELVKGTYEAGGVVSASGTSETPIVIRARPGNDVVIQQGSVPNWVQGEGAMWSANFDYPGLVAAQRAAGNSTLYERGIKLWREAEPLTEACFPNLPEGGTGTHPTISTQGGSSNTVFVNAQIPSGDLRGARAIALPYLKQVSENRRVNSSGAGRVNVNTGFYFMEVDKPFYLEGAKALIDRDYEWAWDEPTGRLWIRMPPRLNPTASKVRIQTSSTAFLLQSASYITIQNLRFRGVVPVATTGSVGVRYDQLNILEAGILQFGDGTYEYAQMAGLVLRENAALTNSTINGCNGRCVFASGRNTRIQNNTIRNGGRIGQFEGAVSIGAADTYLQHNLIENSGRDGIAFTAWGIQGTVVSRNLIRNSGQLAWDAAGITIGKHPDGSVDLDSNLILDVAHDGSGIFLDEASQLNNIGHNVIGGAMVGITAQGYRAEGAYSSRNNAIWHNTILPGVSSFAALRNVTNLLGTQLENNITNALPTIQTIQTTSISSRVSSPSEFFSWGASWGGNLAEGIDARLNDIAAQDFGLQAGSPAIDIGLSSIWGFTGTGPDAGAIESGTPRWFFGPEALVPPSNSTLGFEDPSKWLPPDWDKTPYTKSLSNDRIEGAKSLAISAEGYKVLESAALSQTDLGGWGAISWSMKISEVQPNPWWLGQVMWYISCPSQRFYNVWVGLTELTPMPLNQWQNASLAIPAELRNELQNQSFNDLTLKLIVNLNAGAGPVLFDNLRFIP